MQTRPHELRTRLAAGLAPVYIVSGDEPLQRDECLAAIRAAARAQGFEERVRLSAGAGFDWLELSMLNDSLSLFAERRLIELVVPTGKPGDAGSKALVEYCSRLSPDNLLLVSAPKLDPGARRSKWYRTLESTGVAVQVWPVEASRLPQWLRERASRHGLSLSREAATLLAERVEGNLLAADQEVRKLALLHPAAGGPGGQPVKIDAEQVVEAVAASSRYSIFDAVEAALRGELPRAVRVLQGLREEGMEPVLALWALSRETRALLRMKWALARGSTLAQVMNDERVWERRKAAVSAALGRLSGRALGRVVAQLAQTDRVVKGAAPGSAWDEVEHAVAGLCGVTPRPA